MGHSGGTFIGIQAAARAPHLFHAYVAVAQIVDQRESEVLAYQFMLDECVRRGEKRLARKLQRCPVSRESGLPAEYLRVRDTAMHRLGVGTTREMRSVVTGIFLPSLRFDEYTAAEKLRFWTAKVRSGVSVVWNDLMATDLRQSCTSVDVPIYFLHGLHDYTCSYPLARSYFEQLQAPLKGFYTFTDSAHSPIFEEPERGRRILREDVLQSGTTLAD
jgi:pimeloyl-ACP methyl ester carboxylesterase